MKMSMKDMIAKVTELKELERMAEELSAEIEALKDEVKAEMGSEEELVAGPFKLTYKSVTSSRLDTTALKKAFPAEALAPFMKSSTCRRFSVS